MRGISRQGKTLSDITYLTKPKQLENMAIEFSINGYFDMTIYNGLAMHRKA